MSESNKKSSFVNLFIAMVKGDDAEVQAQKVAIQAKSALKVQINAHEGTLEDKKLAVEEATERVNEALVNKGELIRGASERTRYVQNLIMAKNTLTDAEESLEEEQEVISFLKEQLKQI